MSQVGFTRICVHGRSMYGEHLDHVPEWERVGDIRLEPLRNAIGITQRWWIRGPRCCGKTMLRCKEVETLRCRVCGKTKTVDGSYFMGLCTCCGGSVHNLRTEDWTT